MAQAPIIHPGAPGDLARELTAAEAHGHIFEVTEDGDIVWEYINPVGDRTGDDYGIYKVMTDRAGAEFNSIYKCHRYSAEYAGLQGQDLAPLGKLTELFAEETARPNFE